MFTLNVTMPANLRMDYTFLHMDYTFQSSIIFLLSKNLD